MQVRTIDGMSFSLSEVCVFFISIFMFLNLQGVDPVDYLVAISSFLLIGGLLGKFGVFYTFKYEFFASLAFSIFYVLSIVNGGMQAAFVWNIIINIGILLIILQYVTSERRLRRLLNFLTFSLIASALVGFLQYISILPLVPNQFEVYRDGRFMALFGDPNLLGAFADCLLFYWGAIKVFGR